MIKRITLCLITILLLATTAQADFTFVQISDTHVGNDPAFNARYAEAIRQINELKPAFVILSGDALADFSAENASLFKEISKSLTVPMYISPGNHDVGKPTDITLKKIAAWKGAFDYDRISFQHEDCAFIGPASSLWASGLPAEKEQLDWLKSELKKAKGKRIFIFQHHALFLNKPDDPNGDYFTIDNPARFSLYKLFKSNHIKAILTGHVHRANESIYDNICFISTPATSFSCDADQGLVGYRVFRVGKGGFTQQFVDLRKGGSPPDFQSK